LRASPELSLALGLPCLLLELEFFGAVVPVGDFLGEAILDRSLGLADQFELAPADLGQVFRHDLGDGMALDLLLKLARDPLAFGAVEDRFDAGFARSDWPIVEIGRVVHMTGARAGVHDFDIEHAFRHDPTLAGAGEAGVLDGMFEVEQHTRLHSGIAFINQHAAAFQQIAMTLQRQVDDGVEQRVAGADKCRQRLALRCDERFLEGDPLIARQTGSPMPIRRSRLRTGRVRG
jgi:hypothetical protein